MQRKLERNCTFHNLETVCNKLSSRKSMCLDIFPGENSCGSSYSQTSLEQPLSLRILSGYLPEVCLYHTVNGKELTSGGCPSLQKAFGQYRLGTEAHILTPRYGQYLTHVHNHITPAGAAMDSCFGVIGAHQHGRPLFGKSRLQTLGQPGKSRYTKPK